MSSDPKTKRRNRQNGFTLLELLVAISLLALCSTILFGGLRFGARVWEAADTPANGWPQISLVRNVLQRFISQAMAVPLASEEQLDGRSFIGTSDRIRFVSLSPLRATVGGLYEVDLFTRVENDGTDLVMALAMLRPETNGEPASVPVSETVVVKRIEAVRWDYYGSDDFGRPPSWRGAWDGSASLPMAVRLEIEFPDKDPRRWQPLIVRPAVAAVKSD